jgi:hypothetical protein
MEKIIFQIKLFPKNLFFDDKKGTKSFLKFFFKILIEY